MGRPPRKRIALVGGNGMPKSAHRITDLELVASSSSEDEIPFRDFRNSRSTRSSSARPRPGFQHDDGLVQVVVKAPSFDTSVFKEQADENTVRKVLEEKDDANQLVYSVRFADGHLEKVSTVLLVQWELLADSAKSFTQPRGPSKRHLDLCPRVYWPYTTSTSTLHLHPPPTHKPFPPPLLRNTLKTAYRKLTCS